jgi:transcriptional regulator with XRE-family HTH domain
MNYNRVRDLRLDRDIGLRVMARRLGLDPAHLSRVERGMKHCSYEVMCQIADFLGEPLEVVFPRPGRRPPTP